MAKIESNVDTFYASLATKIKGDSDLKHGRPSTAPGTTGNATTDGVHRNDGAGQVWADAMAKGLGGEGRAAATNGWSEPGGGIPLGDATSTCALDADHVRLERQRKE